MNCMNFETFIQSLVMFAPLIPVVENITQQIKVYGTRLLAGRSESFRGIGMTAVSQIVSIGISLLYGTIIKVDFNTALMAGIIIGGGSNLYYEFITAFVKPKKNENEPILDSTIE